MLAVLTACGSGGGGVSESTWLPPQGPTTAEGIIGGPFAVTNGSYTLQNPGTEPFSYEFERTDPWLDLSMATQGQLASGQQLPFDVSIDDGAAPTTSGTYIGAWTVYESQTRDVRGHIDVTLTVHEPGRYVLNLQPNSGASAQGPVGGPFPVVGGSYVLSNVGDVAFSYDFVGTQNWIQWSVPSTGTVAARGSLPFSVSIDTASAPTTPTIANGNIEIRDATTNVAQLSIAVTLTVQSPGSVTGWTQFTPSQDTRLIYVSSSTGNDNNDGLSEQTPKRTIIAGLNLLRGGFPDWLHLKRGDVFFEDLGNWTLSGRSATEPMVVTTYGTSGDRPLLNTGVDSGLTAWGNGNSISDVAFVGLHFNAHTHDGTNGSPNGVSFLEPATRVLFEDCKFERYFVNLVFQGTHFDIKVRRCVVVDAFTSVAGHAQGLYVDGVDGFLVEECVFDHNGYSTPDPTSFAGADIFRHNIYVQGNVRNFVLRGNIIARGPSHGIQMRAGGTAESNLFMQNAINLLVGSDVGPAINGVPVNVIGNVFLDGRDIDPNTPRGWVADIQSASGGEVAYNIAAHQVSGSNPKGFNFDSWLGAGVNNVDFHHNISYKWGAPVSFSGSRFTALTMRDNDVQEFSNSLVIRADSMAAVSGLSSMRNRFHTTLSSGMWVYAGQNMSLANWMAGVNDTTSTATQVGYPNPDRTIADYDLSAPYSGSGTLHSFLMEARKQSRQNWRDKFVGMQAVQYFQANFGVVVP